MKRTILATAVLLATAQMADAAVINLDGKDLTITAPEFVQTGTTATVNANGTIAIGTNVSKFDLTVEAADLKANGTGNFSGLFNGSQNAVIHADTIKLKVEGSSTVCGVLESTENASLTLDGDVVDIDVVGNVQATGVQTEKASDKLTIGRSGGTKTNITVTAKTDAARVINSYSNGGEVNVLGKEIELESKSEADNKSAWTVRAKNGDKIHIGDNHSEVVTLKSYSKGRYGVVFSGNSGTTVVKGDVVNLVATGKMARIIEMSTLGTNAPGQLTIGDEHSVVNLTAIGEDEGLGIVSQSGTTTIKGAKINLATSGVKSRAVEVGGPGVLVLGESNSVINITSTGVGQGIGVAALKTGANVNIFGSALEITAYGDDATGLLTQNNDDTKPTPATNAASITVKATNTKINSEVIGLASYSGSRMTVDSNLVVDAPTAIEARGNAEMSINPEQDKSVKLKGDIRFATPGSTQGSGEVLDANVVVNLTTADSSWEGNLRREFPTAIADTDKVVVSRGLALKLSNGATWTPTEVQVVSDGDKRVTTLAVNTLSLDNGVINMQKGTQTVEAKTITGTGGTVYVATTQDKEGNIAPQRKISVGSVAEGVTFRVTDGNKTTDDLVDIPKGLEGLQGTIESSDSDKPFEGTVTTFYEQGVINGYAEETVVNGVSQGVKVADNTMLDAYGSVAALTAFQWRHDMNDLSKRMGELRTSPAGVGAWARMYGSEQEYGAQGITQKNTSIQVGSDVDAGLGWKVGAAFTYTDGRSDYAEGSADHHAYGLGVYGTWFSENGQFVDLMAKYSRLDTDFELEHRRRS